MANPFVFFLLIFAVLYSAIGAWPQPRTMSWQVPSATPLSPTFTICSPYPRYLLPAVNCYLQLINLTNGGPSLHTLIVAVKDLSALLSHGVNKSYSVSIPISSDRATLIAEMAWGGTRRLETFSQLIWGKPARFTVGVEVSDWHIYVYKGIMLDTLRNCIMKSRTS